MKTPDTNEPLRSGRLVRRDFCRTNCPRNGWNDAKRAECRKTTMCAPLLAAVNGQVFREIRRFHDAND